MLLTLTQAPSSRSFESELPDLIVLLLVMLAGVTLLSALAGVGTGGKSKGPMYISPSIVDCDFFPIKHSFSDWL